MYVEIIQQMFIIRSSQFYKKILENCDFFFLELFDEILFSYALHVLSPILVNLMSFLHERSYLFDLSVEVSLIERAAQST